MFLENFVYYVACILFVILGIYLLKKFVGCLIRTVITLFLICVLAYIYFVYINP